MLKFLLSSLILLAGSAFSQEKETIYWLEWEQVPNFITQGDYKGQGLGDSFTNSLQRMLPQYNHKMILSNARRYHRLIREENVCVAWAWIVPGSEEFRVHSKAISLAPRTGIQTLKSKQHLFGKPGETLSLAKLLTNPNITLGYLEEMSYTKEVHELLEKYRDKENINFSSRSNVEFNLLMLDNDRLDYFFGYSAQSIFDAKIKGIPNKYQFYNIEEINMFTSLHSHCSKTPFGEKVMSDINNIITQDLLMEHLTIIERWYGKNESYRKVFIDYVINQNPNELVTNPAY